MGRRGACGLSIDPRVQKEAECSLKYEFGVETSLCGLASQRDRVRHQLACKALRLADPTFAGHIARRDDERVGVASGRAIRLDPDNTDAALSEILRVSSTYCLME